MTPLPQSQSLADPVAKTGVTPAVNQAILGAPLHVVAQDQTQQITAPAAPVQSTQPIAPAPQVTAAGPSLQAPLPGTIPQAEPSAATRAYPLSSRAEISRNIPATPPVVNPADESQWIAPLAGTARSIQPSAPVGLDGVPTAQATAASPNLQAPLQGNTPRVEPLPTASASNLSSPTQTALPNPLQQRPDAVRPAMTSLPQSHTLTKSETNTRYTLAVPRTTSATVPASQGQPQQITPSAGTRVTTQSEALISQAEPLPAPRASNFSNQTEITKSIPKTADPSQDQLQRLTPLAAPGESERSEAPVERSDVAAGNDVTKTTATQSVTTDPFTGEKSAIETESARQQVAGKALTENPIFQLELKQVTQTQNAEPNKVSAAEWNAQPAADKASTGSVNKAGTPATELLLQSAVQAPDTRNNSRGTLSATQSYEMKKSAEPVETVSGTEQKVPSREHDSAVPKSELSAFASHAALIRPSTTPEWVAAPHEVRAATSVDKVIESIRAEVVMMRRMQPDMLSVVLRPDSGTEIVVQMTNTNGEVHAHIRCERGDFDGLNAQWGDLERSMAAQGVKLAPLLPSSQPGSTETSKTDLSQGFSGQNAPHQGRRDASDLMFSNQEPLRGKVRPGAPQTAAQTVRTQTEAETAWQKWA